MLMHRLWDLPYSCQRGTCGWLLSIPNIITWNSKGWTLIQGREREKKSLTESSIIQAARVSFSETHRGALTRSLQGFPIQNQTIFRPSEYHVWHLLVNCATLHYLQLHCSCTAVLLTLVTSATHASEFYSRAGQYPYLAPIKKPVIGPSV